MKTMMNQYYPNLLTAFCLLTVSIAIMGCSTTNSDTDDPENEIVDVKIISEEADIEVGESVNFSVIGLTASGEEIPIPEELVTQWWSTNSTVFTVEEGGAITGREEGTAFCVFKASEEGQANKMNKIMMIYPITFDSAFVRVSLPAGF